MGFLFGLAILPYHMALLAWAPPRPASLGPAQVIYITEERRLRLKQKMLRRARRGY